MDGHRDRQTKGQADKWTDIEKDRQMDIQIDRQIGQPIQTLVKNIEMNSHGFGSK